MVMEAPSADERKAAAIREPLLEAEAEASTSTSKGGIRTLPFIIANEALERVATNGISVSPMVDPRWGQLPPLGSSGESKY
ncbi:peptide/nitrate transporter-like protein [Corchorus olitorius]|uniref:Peptide/nitrate transporter-like protein n=1 Tax=Corchorus olitorius TaxID=93759 RepID=A0A1R3J8D4_9ROSI|nr:peptide/nitrate transporter-like protein [Corchorus olitorius]